MNQGSGYCNENYQNTMDTFDNFMKFNKDNQPNLSNDLDSYLSLKEISTGCTKTIYFEGFHVFDVLKIWVYVEIYRSYRT